METSELNQAAANIAGAMAATQYGKFGGMEASRITELATIAVKIARAIETEARKLPELCKGRRKVTLRAG